MPRISLYSPSIASAVLPQGYVPRDASLFGEGRTLPSGGGSTSAMAGGQKGLFGADGGGAMGAVAGMLGGSGLRSVFFGAPEDPRAAQARAAAANYEAEAAKARGEAERAAAGAAATSKLGGAFDELRYRTTRAPGEAAPEGEAGRMRAAGAAALQQALAGGADEKQARALMSAFALGLGDDNEIVRTNAALDDKYLGKGESPSLAAQSALIEDEQRQELEKQDMIEKTRRYGFDKDYEASVYNTNVDASTQRRGQDISAGTSRANNADDNARALEEQRRRARFEELRDQLYPVQTSTSTRDAEGKTETKTQTTRRVPPRASARGAPAAPARGAPQKTRLKYNPATGQLE